MKRIILVNANSYSISIPSETYNLRNDYFRVKSYVKKRKLNQFAPTHTLNTRTYSIGLLRISTILKYNGYDVTYIDFDDFSENYIAINVPHADIVAFSMVTPTVPRCASLCEVIRNTNPKIIIAAGGAHINVAKEQTKQKYDCFDRYADGFDIDGAAKILQVDKNLLKTPPYYVDYSLLPLPLSSYIINTFSTLGCIYKCDYCQDHIIPYYENPDKSGIEAFIGEIPKGSFIHFFDSVLGVIPERTKNVCESLAQINHGFLLSCDARAEVITPEYVKMLENAGFVEIRLGMETTDDTVLRANNRYLTTDKLTKAFETIRNNSNLYISVYNAIGIPGSTARSIESSISITEKLLLDDYIDEVKSGIYVPYPMDGKDYSIRGVTIEDTNWAHYDRQSYPVYRLTDMSSEEIWALSNDFLAMTVNAWVKKCGFTSIDCMPDERWLEYFDALHRKNE